MSCNSRLRPTTLVLLLALVVSLAALTLASSRGAFSDSTDNSGNSFAAAASFGGISQIQKATTGSVGSASSIVATYGSAPTQDNLLVLVHHYRDTGTITLPSGWTSAVAQTGNGSTITIGYKIAGAAEGTGVAVSVSVSDFQTITIFEYAGIDTAAPLDRTASNTEAPPPGNTDCPTGTTAATSVPDELLIAGVGLNGLSSSWFDTWTNGFTQQSVVTASGNPPNDRSESSTADRIVAATGTFETTESWSANQECQAAIATFKGS